MTEQQEEVSLHSGCPNEHTTLQKAKPKQVSFLAVHLEHGVTRLNIITFYLSVLLTVCVFVFMNAAQPFVLSTYLKIPQKDQGKVSGDLGFYNEIMVIVTAPLWGVFSDKIGRKIVYFLGYSFAGIGIILYPLARNFTTLVIYRLIFALGASACGSMLTAVLGDYACPRDRGKASGVMGLMSGFGAIVAALLLLKLPLWFSQITSEYNAGYITYGIVAGIIFCGALFIALGLKVGSSHFVNAFKKGKITKVYQDKDIFTIAKEGLKAAKNPVIALSYYASFVARQDSVVITTFLTLWVHQAMEMKGASRSAAISRAGLISGIAQVFALCFAPFAGILADKIHSTLSMAIGAAIAAVGYTSIAFVPDVTGGWVFLCIAFIGIGEIFEIVTSQVVLTKACPQEVRGGVSGVFAFCGAVGILFTSKVGGYLFDHWMPGSVFLINGIFSAILSILCVILVIVSKILKKDMFVNEKSESPNMEIFEDQENALIV